MMENKKQKIKNKKHISKTKNEERRLFFERATVQTTVVIARLPQAAVAIPFQVRKAIASSPARGELLAMT